MATSNLLSNMMTGNKGAVDLGIQNIGTKPIGNAGGSNLPGPSSVNSTIMPVASAPNLNPLSGQPTLPTSVTGTTAPPNTLLPTNGTTPVNTIPTSGIASGNTGITSGVNPGLLNKQLVDEYGKGVGGLLGSEIANIGSSDDAYIKAYENAVAQPNAENLATLQTSLSNEGVSANSSTAAIAQADFQSGVTADEALQIQQLQKSDEQDILGLTQGLKGTANKAVSETGWSVFGNVLGDIAGATAKAFIPA